jgi:hopanoid-associated phosphorylase
VTTGDLLVVCGLASEAKLVAASGVRTLASGGRSMALARMIERVLDDGGIVGLVSFGLAGALSPDLTAGALLVADGVTIDGETDFTDERWTARLAARLPQAIVAPIAGSDAIVTTAAAKRELAAVTAAVAVDMESHVVAHTALARGLPFVVIRAISDAADRGLPPAATVALKSDGRVDAFAVARSIATAPGQLSDLMRLGSDTRRAMDALREARRLVGTDLAFHETGTAD